MGLQKNEDPTTYADEYHPLNNHIPGLPDRTLHENKNNITLLDIPFFDDHVRNCDPVFAYYLCVPAIFITHIITVPYRVFTQYIFIYER